MCYDEKAIVKCIPYQLLEQKGYTLVGEGRHRRVWLSPSGKYVLKFAINIEGTMANDEEATLYKRQGWRGRYARCRLFYYNNLPCLIMEYVKHVGYAACDDKNKWAWSIDCGQVGYTLDGRLVAYDYSNI